jgi:predicted GIY-YIG superfamily endonuclease
MSGSFYTYILKCADNSYYIGHTEDLANRVERHNSGQGSAHTAARLPVHLVHSEIFQSRAEAMKREAQIKKWSRAKKEALINIDTSSLKSLSKSRE